MEKRVGKMVLNRKIRGKMAVNSKKWGQFRQPPLYFQTVTLRVRVILRVRVALWIRVIV